MSMSSNIIVIVYSFVIWLIHSTFFSQLELTSMADRNLLGTTVTTMKKQMIMEMQVYILHTFEIKI